MAGNVPEEGPLSAVTVETLCPLIESFLGSLSENEWRELKAGRTGLVFDLDILGLFLKIVVIQARALMNRKDGSTKQSLSGLENSLRQSITRTLGLPDLVLGPGTVQSHHLADLLVDMETAVKKYIRSHMKGSTASVSNGTVCNILMKAVRLLTSVLPIVFHTHCTPERYQLFQKEYDLLAGDAEDDDGSELASISLVVRKKLIKVMRRITDYILRGVSKSDLQSLECEILQRLAEASDDVAKAIAEGNISGALSKWESFLVGFSTKLWEYRARDQLSCTVLVGYKESRENMCFAKELISHFNVEPTFTVLETEGEKTDRDEAFAGNLWVFKSTVTFFASVWVPDRNAAYYVLLVMRRTAGIPADVNVFYPIISRCVYGLTADQVVSLQRGKPNSATRMRLAQMFLDVVVAAFGAVREAVGGRNGSSSQHLSGVLAALHLSFCKALALSYPALGRLELCTGWVAREVRAMLKTFHHTGGATGLSVRQSELRGQRWKRTTEGGLWTR